MPVTNYYSINGEIIGEQTAGKGRINYMIDASGSVVGTIAGSAVQNTYAYGPYGRLLARAREHPVVEIQTPAAAAQVQAEAEAISRHTTTTFPSPTQNRGVSSHGSTAVDWELALPFAGMIVKKNVGHFACR